MTISRREYDFQAARRRLEAKPKSAGEKLTTIDEAAARVKDGDSLAFGGCLLRGIEGGRLRLYVDAGCEGADDIGGPTRRSEYLSRRAEHHSGVPRLWSRHRADDDYRVL